MLHEPRDTVLNCRVSLTYNLGSPAAGRLQEVCHPRRIQQLLLHLFAELPGLVLGSIVARLQTCNEGVGGKVMPALRLPRLQATTWGSSVCLWQAAKQRPEWLPLHEGPLDAAYR